jgi:CofH subfamily radical SAM domain protein
MTTLASVLLNETRPEVRAILEKSLSGGETSWQEGVVLSGARGRELHALTAVADELRRQQVGDRVSYVVNRNINFTNVCVKTCRFCAFARGIRSEQGYMLPHDEVVARVLQAKAMGATEVCLQAGLAPDLTGDSYVQLTEAVRRAAPDLHIHAFSPEEVLFGSQLAREPVPVFLARLKDAGLGSLPGTSAEILDDELRKRIAPTRISTANWIHVIESAHELGIPTTSTMMFGHVETAEQRMRHLDTLRSIQKRTGGFTEFVPLSFVHAESPLFVKHEVPGVTPRAQRRRRGPALRHRAAHAGGAHPQPAGLVGEGGHPHQPVAAALRRERPGRHAHEREHLHGGGGHARPAHDARWAAPRHPRCGACARAAQHAV